MDRLGEALRLAETEGLPPAPQHQKIPGRKRERNAGMFSSEPQKANPTAVAALRLLMLTGWREKEALTLRWDAVDFARGLVTLQDTKSGRSIRALPSPALALVADQPKLDGCPYVFPGKIEGKPIQEIQRLWYAVRAAARLEDVRLHDLRHSVASLAAARGHSLLLIGKLLGHKDQRSAARYAHLADDARKAVADDVGEAIAQSIRPSTEVTGKIYRASK
jgi:integrase